MSLTLCPHCRKLCFTDAGSCPGCREIFKVGALQAQAVAEETAFTTKVNVLFLSAFLTLLAVLLFVELHAH